MTSVTLVLLFLGEDEEDFSVEKSADLEYSGMVPNNTRMLKLNPL